MKEKYAIENLIAGNMLFIVPSKKYGPTCEVSKIVFIAEKAENQFDKILTKISEKSRYYEIFTGHRVILIKDKVRDNLKCKYFKVTYLTNIKEIKDYVSPTILKEGYITRDELLAIYCRLYIESIIMGD